MSRISGFFTENLGQAGNPEVRFYSSGTTHSAGLMPGGVMLGLTTDRTGTSVRTGAMRTYSLRIAFEGCEPVEPVGMGQLATERNYLLGPDPSDWARGARSFEEVWYRDLWAGVDLRFHFIEGLLKYDLLLDGGVDPSRIVLGYEGSEGLHVDPVTGDLLVETPVGPVRDTRPVVTQEGLPDGGIEAGFVPLEGDRVGFAVPSECDRDRPLVIDPGLEFSTFLGGSETDDIYAVALDDDRSIYVAGMTRSSDFPLTGGIFTPSVQNGFVAKLDSDCSDLVFSTVFGGNGDTKGLSLAIRPDGSIIVAGSTESGDFPTTVDGHDLSYDGAIDAFVLALNASGSTVIYGSYFGGAGEDMVCQVHVGADGSLVLCGSTESTGLPTTAGAFCQTLTGSNYDVFLVKFAPALGTISLCTYFGGVGAEVAVATYIADDGTTYITGHTYANSFPCTPGAFCSISQGSRDVFVSALKPDWSGLVLSTLIGGGDQEQGQGIGVTPNGTVCVTGFTRSGNFPVSPDAYQTSKLGNADAFVFLLSSDGSERTYGTFWGGSLLEEDGRLCMDTDNGRFIITGSTRSTDLETSVGCYNPEFTGGNLDIFLSCFDYTKLMISYSTYIGGAGDDLTGIEAPMACLVDPDGGIIVAGITAAPDFPATVGAYQTAFGGILDGFILRLTTVPAGLPPVPTGLAASAGDGYIDLSWDKPSGQGSIISKHRIYRGDDVPSLAIYGEVGRLSGYTDENAVNGRYYYYAVSAVNSAGESGLSTPIRARALGAPSEPLGLVGVSNDGTVNLSWDPPAYDGGGDVQGYRIERGPFSDELAPYADVGNVTTFIDADVTLGEFYFYRVHAFNMKGDGNLSAVVRIKALNVPSAPPSFAVEPGDGQVHLSWGMPTRIGGSMLLGFKVYRGATPETMALLATLGPMALEHTDTGLTNGQDYIYYVTAYSEVGESQMSVVLDAIPFTLPGQPLALVALAGDRFVELAWEPPGSDGGRPVTHYNVYSGDDPGDLQLLVSIGAVTTFNNTGLTNGVTYYYQVQSVTEAGESPRSAVASARPMGLPGPPTDLAGASASGGVRLTWRAPTSLGGADSLTYTVLRGSTTDGLAVITTGVDALEYFDASIVVGSTYFYSVRAASSVGEGPLATPVSVSALAVPGPVLNLHCVPGDGKVELRWDAPASTGGTPVTGYIVLRGLLETGMAEVARVGTVLNYTDATVTNGKRYLYAVQAVNVVGTGPRGEIVDATPIGAPGAVGLLTAKAKDGAIVLTWAAPAAAGRAPVTGYIVLRGVSADSLAQLADLGDVLTYTDLTVEEGKTYFYSVVPKSGVGDGQRAPAVTGKVPTLKDGPGPGAVAAVGAFGVLAAVATARRRR